MDAPEAQARRTGCKTTAEPLAALQEPQTLKSARPTPSVATSKADMRQEKPSGTRALGIAAQSRVRLQQSCRLRHAPNARIILVDWEETV